MHFVGQSAMNKPYKTKSYDRNTYNSASM